MARRQKDALERLLELEARNEAVRRAQPMQSAPTVIKKSRAEVPAAKAASRAQPNHDDATVSRKAATISSAPKPVTTAQSMLTARGANVKYVARDAFGASGTLQRAATMHTLTTKTVNDAAPVPVETHGAGQVIDVQRQFTVPVVAARSISVGGSTSLPITDRSRWSPPQTDADSCFFNALLVALFTSVTVSELLQNDALQDDQPEPDTRVAAALAALAALGTICSDELVQHMCNALHDFSLAPLDALLPNLQRAANAHLRAQETLLTDRTQLDVVVRLLQTYNATVEALQRDLKATQLPDSAAKDYVDRVWRVLRRIADVAYDGRALESINVYSLIGTTEPRLPESFTTSDLSELRVAAVCIRTLDEIKFTATRKRSNESANAALREIAAALYASRVDYATPAGEMVHMTSSWRALLFRDTFSHLLQGQQSADETMRAFLDILGARGTQQSVHVKMSVPDRWSSLGVSISVSESVAAANARLKLPQLPYFERERHNEACEVIDTSIGALGSVYPLLKSSVHIDAPVPRSHLSASFPERAPALLILSRAAPLTPLHYGNYVSMTRCVLRVRVPHDVPAIWNVTGGTAALETALQQAAPDAQMVDYELKGVVCWNGHADGSSGHYVAWTYEDECWFYYNSGCVRRGLAPNTNPETITHPALSVWAPSRAGVLFVFKRARS